MKHNPIIPMGELGRYLDEAKARRREQEERDERAKNATAIATMMIAIVEPRDAAMLRADAELLYAADIVAGGVVIPSTPEEAQIAIMLRMARLWRYAGGGT